MNHIYNIGADEIPVFFSTDDNYIPFLDVALASMIENASKEYKYRIVVLNTGLDSENVAKIKQRERAGFKIDFVDMSEDLKHIKVRFKNVYHFSIVTYYRLFIASMFPNCDKIVYLDCDLVVLGGFSKKHCTDPSNPEYIERFIIECNKGVLTHRLSYPAGFLAMLTLSGIPVFTVALPVAIVNVYLNILPTLALRYNTPKLKLILERLRRKAKIEKTVS